VNTLVISAFGLDASADIMNTDPFVLIYNFESLSFFFFFFFFKASSFFVFDVDMVGSNTFPISSGAIPS